MANSHQQLDQTNVLSKMCLKITWIHFGVDILGKGTADQFILKRGVENGTNQEIITWGWDANH